MNADKAAKKAAAEEAKAAKKAAAEEAKAAKKVAAEEAKAAKKAAAEEAKAAKKAAAEEAKAAKAEKKQDNPSSYKSLFYDGTNNDESEYMGKYHTDTHSKKIKAGNDLEEYVADDIEKYSSYKFYSKETKQKINDPDIVTPCVIEQCTTHKELYEQYGEECKNKESIVVDFVIIPKKGMVSIVELKNGCVFDTKKSKGEVECLEATKNLLHKLGCYDVEASFCCYDAIHHSDIKLKTTMGTVKTMLYSELAEKCGLDSVESRHRIDQRIQSMARKNVEATLAFAKQIILNRGKDYFIEFCTHAISDSGDPIELIYKILTHAISDSGEHKNESINKMVTHLESLRSPNSKSDPCLTLA